ERRVLRDAGARHRRADAVGSLPRARVEGQPGPRVGARPGQRHRAGGSRLMPALRDLHGRPLRNLRISVTDRCNLRCQYCMPEEEYVWLPRAEILHFEEIATLVDAFGD